MRLFVLGDSLLMGAADVVSKLLLLGVVMAELLCIPFALTVDKVSSDLMVP